MKKFHDYTVEYQERNNQSSFNFEMVVTCENLKKAKRYASSDLGNEYKVVSVKRKWE